MPDGASLVAVRMPAPALSAGFPFARQGAADRIRACARAVFTAEVLAGLDHALTFGMAAFAQMLFFHNHAPFLASCGSAVMTSKRENGFMPRSAVRADAAVSVQS